MDVKSMVRPVIAIRSICLFIVLMISAGVYAQVNFTTVVGQTTVSRNEVFQVEYIVENAKKIEDFDPPPFRNFIVLQGPVQSSGMSYVNGNLTQFKALVFLLQARRTGKLIVPGATALIDGKRRQSEAVSIEVINSRSSNPSGGRPLRFNLPSRVEADREFVLYPNESAIEKIKKNLFVKVEVDKRECYVNEPVVATYKLYSRLRSESRVVKRPSFNGFSVYDMSDPEVDNPSIETVNGRQYNVHVIRQSQLFPLQAGEFVLDPVEVENTVRFIKAESEQDNYLEEIPDPYAETVEHTLTLASASVNINVKPLPATTQASFDGAVGKFAVSASLKNPVVKSGEAASLVVEIKGKGNIPMINAPAVNWPQGFEAFDPSAKEEVHPQTAPLSGVKTFEYVFTPDDSGRVVIPAIAFTYFDPAAKAYKTDSTDSLSLNVLPGTKKVKAGKKLLPSIVNPPAQNIWLWMGAGALVTLLIIGAAMANARKRNKRTASPIAKAPAVQVPVEVRPDPLQRARRMIGVSTAEAFIKEVESAIWTEASEKLNIPPVALNQPQVITGLKNKGADESTIELFRSVINDCESALYIPGQSVEDLQAILDKAERFLKRLDALK